MSSAISSSYSSVQTNKVVHAHWDLLSSNVVDDNKNIDDDGCSHDLLSAQVLFSTSMNAVIVQTNYSSNRNNPRKGTTTNIHNDNSNDFLIHFSHTIEALLRVYLFSKLETIGIETNFYKVTVCHKTTNCLYKSSSSIQFQLQFTNQQKIHDMDSFEILQTIHEHLQSSLITPKNTEVSTLLQSHGSHNSFDVSVPVSKLTREMTIEAITMLLNEWDFKKDEKCDGIINNHYATSIDLQTTNKQHVIQSYITSVSYIFCSIYILVDVLSIKSISCVPIPIDVAIVRQYSHVLVHVPIQMILQTTTTMTQNNSISSSSSSSSSCKFTLAGVILLKQLLVSLPSSSSGTSPMSSFQLIQPMSVGMIWDDETKNYETETKKECEQHNISSKKNHMQMRLFLGTISQTTTTTCKPVHEHNSTMSSIHSHTNPNERINVNKDEEDENISSGVLSDVIENNEMIIVETNIDDMTAEHLAHATNILLTIGKVADVWIVPIVMKKGRAGHTLKCLCTQQQQDLIVKLIFLNTTTLGIRIIQPIHRISLKRTIVSVQVPTYKSNDGDNSSSSNTVAATSSNTNPTPVVDVKIGYLNNDIVSMKAEFDHCQMISIQTGIPIQQIATDAVELARKQLSLPGSS